MSTALVEWSSPGGGRLPSPSGNPPASVIPLVLSEARRRPVFMAASFAAIALLALLIGLSLSKSYTSTTTISVDDGTASILNQNDSHPLDLEKLMSFSKPEAYFTQVSGAIWWPMVYDLPQDAKQNFAKLKRDAQNKRAMYYIEKVDAEHVFPMAGPPMFLSLRAYRTRGSRATYSRQIASVSSVEQLSTMTSSKSV